MRLVLLCLACLVAAVTAETASAWTWPAGGPVLKTFDLGDDPYAGGQHRGVDVGAVDGEDVLAPAGGRIAFAGSVPGGGRTVTIETPHGLSVTLVHLGAYTVHRDDAVAEGAVVGRASETPDGEWRRSYIHLGVRRTEDPHGYLDPLTLLPPRGGNAAQPAPEPPAVEAPVPEPSPAPVAAEPAPTATQTPAPRATPAPLAPVPVAPTPVAAPAGPTLVPVPAEPTPVPAPAAPVAAAPAASPQPESGPAPTEPVLRPLPAAPPSPRAAPPRPTPAPAVSGGGATPPAVTAATGEQPAPPAEQSTPPAAAPDPVLGDVSAPTDAGVTAPPVTVPADTARTADGTSVRLTGFPPDVTVADVEPVSSATVEPSRDVQSATVWAARRSEAGTTAAGRTRRSGAQPMPRSRAFGVRVRGVDGPGGLSVRNERGVRTRAALAYPSGSAVPRRAMLARAPGAIRVGAAAPPLHAGRGSARALLLAALVAVCGLLGAVAASIRRRRRMPVAEAAEVVAVQGSSVRTSAQPCAARPTSGARRRACGQRVVADPFAELLRGPRPRPAPPPVFRGCRGRSLGRLHAGRAAIGKVAV